MSARIYGGSGRPGPRQPHDASNQPPSSASRRPVLADANLQVHGIGVGPPSSQPESAFYGPAGHSFGMYMGQAHGAGQAHGTRRGRGRTELLPQAAPMLSGPPASPLTFADLLRVAGDRATGRPALSNGEGVSAVVAETLSSQCSLAARIARFRANLPPPLGWVAFEVRHDETFEMPPGFAKDPSAWLAKWLVRYADGEKGTKVASRTPCCRRS
ncbi:MAG TPA: hypothetical protein VFH51_07240 [Myxococcota bacterium]|nr:hypothetical protein [Myxococcota bacterium]